MIAFFAVLVFYPVYSIGEKDDLGVGSDVELKIVDQKSSYTLSETITVECTTCGDDKLVKIKLTDENNSVIFQDKTKVDNSFFSYTLILENAFSEDTPDGEYSLKFYLGNSPYAYVEIFQFSKGGMETSVPGWIKTNAGYWANDAIDDQTFLMGIGFLVENGIIQT